MSLNENIGRKFALRFGSLLVLLKKGRLPKKIIIEPTNLCNLRCPVCATHIGMKRDRGFMDWELYKGIIDELQQLPKKPEIQFRMCGEPLLHPEIAEFVRYAEAHGHSTMISTNCTLLNGKLGRNLIEAGLSKMFLALDGLSKESYESYRIGANFEKVKKNIENFAALKQTLKRGRPELIIQTLLTSRSENEVDDMKKWAHQIGVDQVNFKSLSMGIYTTPEMKKKYSYLMPTQKILRRLKTNKTKYCITPLKHIMIYWNGDLGLCCKDFDNDAQLPNMVADGFLKTFHSKTVHEKRMQGMHRQHKLCINCDMNKFSFRGFSVKFP